ncbi:MAG: hypothetical protein VX046_05485 [Bacteroidota bacterium]|nr:hypothetical protein [Bacteroidota bacterium]MEC8248345.1 hypothetical protein [Bacteroidota bacterium]MEC8829981.1 hypothetical protein [Bacteroidota bacterium]
MKKITYLLLLTIISNIAFAQSKNFIDQPYLETTVKVNTLVVPDQIFMSIYISEGEDRNKISLEKQDKKMAVVLDGLEIDLKIIKNYKTQAAILKIIFLNEKMSLNLKFIGLRS